MLVKTRKCRIEMVIWLLVAADRSGGKSTYLAQQDKLPFVSYVKGKLRALDAQYGF